MPFGKEVFFWLRIFSAVSPPQFIKALPEAKMFPYWNNYLSYYDHFMGGVGGISNSACGEGHHEDGAGSSSQSRHLQHHSPPHSGFVALLAFLSLNCIL